MTIYLFILWLRNRRQSRGIGLYLIGNGIVSLFTLTLWFQGQFPDFISIVLSNTFVMVGEVLIYISIYLFNGKKIEKSVRIISVLVPVLAFIEQIIFTYVSPNVRTRIIFMTITGETCNFILWLALVKSGKSLGFVGKLLIFSVSILLLNGISRLFLTLNLANVQYFLNVASFQSAFVIVRSIIMSFWPFAFAMLILERSRNIAEDASLQKSILLRELSHRTKNNMSVIISLIDMQILALPNGPDFDLPYIRQLLISTKNRIYSLALVHKKLLNAKDISKITISDYFTDLVENLRISLGHEDNKIDFRFDLADIAVSMETAGHLGLILNELLTNSIKYAFADGRSARIDLKIKRQEDGFISFAYSDNGPGLPPGFAGPANSVGLPMIKILSEEQLRGTMNLNTEGGFNFNLRFKDDLYEQRIAVGN